MRKGLQEKNLYFMFVAVAQKHKLKPYHDIHFLRCYISDCLL